MYHRYNILNIGLRKNIKHFYYCLRLIFYYAYRLCGYDSAFTIANIPDTDINYLNEFGKQLYDEIGLNGWNALPMKEKVAIMGSFHNNPAKFEIGRGEKILIQNIIRHTAKKNEEHGYGYFDITNLSEPQYEHTNVFFLETKGKFIFADKGSIAWKKSASHDSIDMSSTVTIADVPTNIAQQSNVVFVDREPSREHFELENNSEMVELSSLHEMELLLKPKLIERLNKVLNEPNLQADATLSRSLKRNVHKTTLQIKDINGSKTAVIICFCGSKSTIKLVSNKTGGHWRYFSWDRHLRTHVYKKNKNNVYGNVQFNLSQRRK